jgi:hypothetical protein
MTERFQAGMTRGNVIRCEAPVDLLGPGALRGHFQADGGTGLEWMNDQLQFCGLLASQIISVIAAFVPDACCPQRKVAEDHALPLRDSCECLLRPSPFWSAVPLPPSR